MTGTGSGTRTITVLREAVCLADDQSNPLELVLRLPADATLAGLADAVLAQDFLQFSSTHHTITGFAMDRPVVRVHCGLFRKRVAYLLPADTSLAACLPDGRMEFRWMRP